MKRHLYLWVVAMVGISITGCYTPQGRPDYTASGALAGAATGATIGGIAGRGPGAAFGGAMGAIVGSLIGHGLDQNQEAQLRAQAPQTMQRIEQGQPLTVPDVKALVSAGISDDLIISQIRNSRTVYRLSTAEIIDLKNSGASERIIDFMINTPTQTPSATVAGVAGSVPPAPQPETIVVAPGPDYVWVGGAWFWMGNGWAWHRGYWHRPLYPYGYGYRYGRRWR